MCGKAVWKRINDSITSAVDTLMLGQLIEERKSLKKKWKVRAWKKNVKYSLNKTGGKKMGKMIYLDNAATTKMHRKYVKQCFRILQIYGNPVSIYDFAGKSKEASRAREQIADVSWQRKKKFISQRRCESDNWALKGYL